MRSHNMLSVTSCENDAFTAAEYKVPYFSCYKTEIFLLPKQSKNLDPSYKMDLDLWDCLGMAKLVL